jgi:acetyltransferase-like isoleucine patch superfamily enzyme
VAAPLRIPAGTPQSRAIVANVERAMRFTAEINRLTYADLDRVRVLFGELTQQETDDAFRLIPPFWTDQGVNIRVGRAVFINQCCTLYDIGGIEIGDDVMIGPQVSLITSSHPVDPAERRNGFVAEPITLERNVWLGAGVTVIGGVTVGENSVVAAGAVVTRDVAPNTLVGGNPARLIRDI